MEEIANKVNQVSQCPDRNSKTSPTEYKSKITPLLPPCLDSHCLIRYKLCNSKCMDKQRYK